MKRIKIGIIWANPYNKNLGVAALAYSSIAIIKKILDENNTVAKFTFVTTTKKINHTLVINNESYKFNSIIGLNIFKLKSLIKLCIFPVKFNTIQQLSFDYVFDISEGDSFTDIYGQERYTNMLNSKKFYSILRKKQLLLPQTIGPFNREKNEKAAFSAMQKLDIILSRDKQSYDYTSRFLPKDKIVELIDLAFYLPFEHKTFSNNKINVGINVSGLLWNGGYTKNNQFNLKTDYQKLIREAIRYFESQSNIQIHLIPHVVPTDNPVEDDYACSEKISNDFNTVILAPRFETPVEAKSYISGLDFFTGARMHSCIAAFSSGVPVFPMAYSRKFNGLFEDTLEYNFIGDMVNQETDNILTKLKSSFEKRVELKSIIQHRQATTIIQRGELLKQHLIRFLNL